MKNYSNLYMEVIMEKAIIVSVDLIFNGEEVIPRFLSIYNEFKDKIQFMFVTNNLISRRKLKRELNANYLFSSHQIKIYLSYHSSKVYFFSLGYKDLDYDLAKNNKLIFLNGDWRCAEPIAKNYGLQVSFELLPHIIKMIINNEHFYYQLEIDDNTELFSILDPRSKGDISAEEKTLLLTFEKILKNNDKKKLEILRMLFLIMVTKNEKLKKVNYWTSYPSSSGVASENIRIIESDIRILTGCVQKDCQYGIPDLFIRHTPIQKSHCMEEKDRISCDRHFQSIHLNPEVKGRLKDKTICILDDYSTKGTTSEVCRNLLKNEGIKKLYILTLGKFNSYYRTDHYKYQEYQMEGDIFTKTYSFTLLTDKNLAGTCTNNSEEMVKLYFLMEIM